MRSVEEPAPTPSEARGTPGPGPEAATPEASVEAGGGPTSAPLAARPVPDPGPVQGPPWDPSGEPAEEPWRRRPPHSGVPPRTPGCVRCIRYGGDHVGRCIFSWEEVGG